MDFDTWFVEQLCNAASDRASRDNGVSSLVLPAIPFGPTPEHRNYGAGYVDVPVDVHAAMVSSVLVSLAEQGFRRIVVWRGCGGHDLRDAVERFNEAFSGRSTAFLPPPRITTFGAGLLTRRYPVATPTASQRRSRSICVPRPSARTGLSTPSTGPLTGTTRTSISPTTLGPAPSATPPTPTAELGAKLWEAVVDAVAATLASIAQGHAETAVAQERRHFLQRPDNSSTR